MCASFSFEVGAGGATSWRRYGSSLVQVRFWGGDLRHHNAQNRDSRHRLTLYFLTCATKQLYLLQ